jgi:hypothetical protein
LLPRYLVSNNRVAILDADSKLHYADIIIARQEGSNVIVTNGLKEGDQLIVSALDYPVDGMKLALQGSKSEVINQDALETQIASTKD